MTDWWRAVEDELERRGDHAPDPWGTIGLPADDPALTLEQRDFLAQVTDLPLHGLDPDDFEPDDFEPGTPG